MQTHTSVLTLSKEICKIYCLIYTLYSKQTYIVCAYYPFFTYSHIYSRSLLIRLIKEHIRLVPIRLSGGALLFEDILYDNVKGIKIPQNDTNDLIKERSD